MKDAMATAPDRKLEASEHISPLIEVAAEEHDGMRRQLEQPDAEQVERVRRFVAATPSPRRA
jgi:hypothetical protein